MTRQYLTTLAIETSCDETGVAIYHQSRGLLANQLHSQTSHQDYGGVVPELASRDHIRLITPLIKKALLEAKLTLADIDGIAYTAGPGLAGALLVGSGVAQSLGLGLQVPTLAVHHMEGHLLAPFLEDKKPTFPFLSLLVSGGHTMLVDVKKAGCYQVIGESVDDAAGEAFDKTAKLLGLGYPGGAQLAKLATQGNGEAFNFPRPMTKKKTLDFSFSGLKTCVRNTLMQYPEQKVDIAASFERAAVDTLVIKCALALTQTKRNCLVVAGGVSANKTLRAELDNLSKKMAVDVFFPRFEFCTDNAAMIALAGHWRLSAGQKQNNYAVDVKPKWHLQTLQAI